MSDDDPAVRLLAVPPAPPPPPPPPPRRPRTRRLASLALALIVLLATVTARLFVWPDLPPLPDHADAIVQLGGPGDRRALAFDLARAGRAPVVAISVATDEAATTWCNQGRYEGLSVVCFHSEPFTTRGEARSIGDLARRYGWHSVILVTTPDQAWRATVRVGRCFPGAIFVAQARLPRDLWPTQVLYQMGATVKAYTVETEC